MAIAYFVNSAEHTVTQVEYETLDDMRRFVGGYICIAFTDHSVGDVMYVDDEGLLKEPKHFFMHQDCSHPFAGNGLYVGSEIENESAQGYTTLPPKVKLATMRKRISFYDVG